MKISMNIKKKIQVALGTVLLVCLTACGQAPAAPSGPKVETPAPKETAQPKISSVEIYNKTGKIQREDFYTEQGQVSHSVEYSYSDAGYLTEIKKTAGGLGSDKVMESRLYSGANCTQRIVYDANGSTQTVYYWTYDKKGNLTKARTVEMIPAANGYSYSGKAETITLYDGAGHAQQETYAAPGDYSRDEYEYDASGNLRKDSYFHSSDGKTFRLFDVILYEYDENGCLVSVQKSDSLGNVYETEVMEYSEEGLLRKDTLYSSAELTEENQILQYYYEYNDAGCCTFSAEYKGRDSKQIYYEYDASGNITVESEVRYSNGNPVESVITTRQYDTRSNLTRETVKRPDGVERLNLVCQYKYYSDGKIQTKTNFECY